MSSYSTGDVVIFNGAPAAVSSVDGDKLQLLTVATGPAMAMACDVRLADLQNACAWAEELGDLVVSMEPAGSVLRKRARIVGVAYNDARGWRVMLDEAGGSEEGPESGDEGLLAVCCAVIRRAIKDRYEGSTTKAAPASDDALDEGRPSPFTEREARAQALISLIMEDAEIVAVTLADGRVLRPTVSVRWEERPE